MAEDRVYEEVYLPGSRRKTRILVAPAGAEEDPTARTLVDTLNHNSEYPDAGLSNHVNAVAIAGSVEEAEDWAAKEAEASGVTPSAVMHSAPEGYGSGAKDQGTGTLTEGRVKELQEKTPFEHAAETKENVELPDPPRVGLSEEEAGKSLHERVSAVKDDNGADQSPFLKANKENTKKSKSATRKETVKTEEDSAVSGDNV